MGALGLSTLAFIPFLLLELCILRIYSLWYCITYKDSLQEFATVIIHMIITAIAMSSGTKDPSQIAGSFDTLVALQSLFLWMGLSAHFRFASPLPSIAAPFTGVANVVYCKSLEE